MTSATGSNSRGQRTEHGGQSARRVGSPRGLTLIELLVSVAILASASVLVVQAFIRGAYAMTTAANRLRAYEFASAKMADLELNLDQGVAPETAGQFRIGGDLFQWKADMAASDSDPELALVTLTVGWHQGPHGYETSVSALRRVAKKPS